MDCPGLLFTGNSSCSEQLFEGLVSPSYRLRSDQSSSAHAMSRKSPGSVRMQVNGSRVHNGAVVPRKA